MVNEMSDAAARRDRERADTRIGERLRKARLLGGLSTRDLDSMSGMAAGHTSMIETGRRNNLEVRTATSIANVLGLTLDWLLRGAGASPTKESVEAAIARANHAKPKR